MRRSQAEPEFQYSEAQVSEKSPIAASFLRERSRLTEKTLAHGDKLLGRLFNLDHNTYLEGSLPARTKELMGLSVSAGLRCDDCIFYHAIQCYRLGVTRAEIDEALNVAAVIGGTIVVPHLRRCYELLDELYGEG